MQLHKPCTAAAIFCWLLIPSTLLSHGPQPGEAHEEVSGAGPLDRSYRVDPELGHHVEHLRFSTTQSWDPELLERSTAESRWIPEAVRERLALPQPPANSSPQTRAELDYLRTLRSLRSETARAAIDAEVPLEGFWTPAFVADNGGPSQFPATTQLVFEMMAEAQPVVMAMKARFDRVRPHVLASELEPTIEVPSHPAYPSGHATQAYMLAYVFQELDPDGAMGYLERAQEIAWHRELAGVHYPTDSFAGQLLARQIIDALWERPEFRTRFTLAKREWQAQGLVAPIRGGVR